MSTQSRALFWLRVKAFAYDYVIISGYLLLVVAAGVAFTQLAADADPLILRTPLGGQLLGFLTVTLPVTLYFAISESSARQATWGKGKMGLTVTDKAGNRLSFGRALLRTALKFVPWELAHFCIWQISFAGDNPSLWITVGFGLVWVLLGVYAASLLLSPSGRTLYDRLSGVWIRP